jgi:hypothetical protein
VGGRGVDKEFFCSSLLQTNSRYFSEEQGRTRSCLGRRGERERERERFLDVQVTMNSSYRKWAPSVRWCARSMVYERLCWLGSWVVRRLGG